MSTTQAGDRSYYIDDFSDEILPCDCTLAAWAAWLAVPAPDWGRRTEAKDGDRFQVSVMRWGSDIVASCDADGAWSFDREEPTASFYAIRYAAGAGWDPDHIVDGLDGARELLAEYGDSFGSVEYIAIGFDDPIVNCVYRSDPPRLEIEGTVQ